VFRNRFSGSQKFLKTIGNDVTVINNQLNTGSLNSCCNALSDMIIGLQNGQMTAENEAGERQKLSRSSAQITHFLECAQRAPKIAEFAFPKLSIRIYRNITRFKRSITHLKALIFSFYKVEGLQNYQLTSNSTAVRRKTEKRNFVSSYRFGTDLVPICA
jgi:hypothetical protein